ncbi:redoxin domain-containing protein [Cellulomonas pakistanensis]|uniref:Peroxiredoxin n=1 Tax=Cellulomonas pakistanensis TaxID=992287 RepID=A0A919PER3_9CELL|nr:redoxin domain-containing protein [Cellulomonas pakistanensis]GIG36827.1 peroxiredoxin [Cellulomonas pakistanensis]
MSGAAGMPVLGDPAPVLTLPDAHGAPVTVGGPVDGPVLLVFVPFAFSRVCTAELGELQEHLPELVRAGVRVRAVSCDPAPALRAWAEQDGYAFPLLSDFWPHGAAARAYGVFDDADGYARRGSFLLDASGVLRWSLVHDAGRPRPFGAYREAVAGL